MSGYTIEIRGYSNDSDFILNSASGSITENASATDLTPLTTRVSTLETSMNLVEPKVTTLETSMNTLANNIEEVDKLSLVNSYVSGTKNLVYTFTVGFNNMTSSQLESTLEESQDAAQTLKQIGEESKIRIKTLEEKFSNFALHLTEVNTNPVKYI